MIIAARYSFNSGADFIEKHYLHLLEEVEEIIANVHAKEYKTKKSKEKTMSGKMLFSPPELNKEFKRLFYDRNWVTQRISCEYSTRHYTNNYKARNLNKGAFREMDFIKENLGIEVQFGKYAFIVYNVCAKMTIFNKMSFINAGIEIVPVKQFAHEMSSGVSYFEQFIWDLEKRGVSDIDIPVLILGVDISDIPATMVKETTGTYGATDDKTKEMNEEKAKQISLLG